MKSKFNILFEQIMSSLMKNNYCRFAQDCYQSTKKMAENLTDKQKQQLNKKWDAEILEEITDAKNNDKEIYLCLIKQWKHDNRPNYIQFIQTKSHILNIYQENNQIMCQFYTNQGHNYQLAVKDLNRLKKELFGENAQPIKNYYDAIKTLNELRNKIQQSTELQSWVKGHYKSNLEIDQKWLKAIHHIYPISHLMTEKTWDEYSEINSEFEQTRFPDKYDLINNCNDDIKFLLKQKDFRIEKDFILDLLKGHTARQYAFTALLDSDNISQELLKKFHIDTNTQEFKKAQKNFDAISKVTPFYMNGGDCIQLIATIHSKQGEKFDVSRLYVQFSYKYEDAEGDNAYQMRTRGYIRD